ncbi:MAG TPA: hypothetical protein VFW35_01580 [Sphingomicrobium sp.]|nr:hypothetical protein [Sphingomicrobium sp.]
MDEESIAGGIWSAQMSMVLIGNLVSTGLMPAEIARKNVDDAYALLAKSRPHDSHYFLGFASEFRKTIDMAEASLGQELNGS